MNPTATNTVIAAGRRTSIPVAALLVMGALSAVVGLGDMLDDALIHLRYAEHVLAGQAFEYNAGEPSYGTSSPLYVILLAALRWVPVSYHLPKLVSGAFWILLAVSIWQLSRTHSGSVRLALILLALAIVSPFGHRWLASGMETSIVALWSAVMAAICADFSRNGESVFGSLGVLAMAVTAPLLRVELIALVAAFVFVAGTGAVRARASLRPALAGLVGAMAGIALLWPMFGSITPDTAVAKSMPLSLYAGFAHWADTGMVVISAHLAASFFGVALAFLVTSSFIWSVIRTKGWQRVAVAGINLLYPLFIFLIAARHQSVHGIRYFLFLDFFLIIFNLHIIQSAATHENRRSAGATWLRLAATSALAIWTIFDSVMFGRLAAERAETYRALSEMDLAQYAEKPCIGADIGAFGYFSKCRVSDLSGLVNGREMAELSSEARHRHIANTNPVLAFVNERQLAGLSSAGLHLESWLVLARLNLPNVRGSDLHLLLAKPGTASEQN
jgi:hypothetical protein